MGRRPSTLGLIDVRVRINKSKLGDLLENLPIWGAQMVGYDLLRTEAPDAAPAANGHAKPKKNWKAKPNPNYKPKHNSAGDVVLKLLVKGAMTRGEIMDAYKGDKFNRNGLQSGLYGLRDHGLIKQNGDGKYEVIASGQ